jgi:hypothetical protein
MPPQSLSGGALTFRYVWRFEQVATLQKPIASAGAGDASMRRRLLIGKNRKEVTAVGLAGRASASVTPKSTRCGLTCLNSNEFLALPSGPKVVLPRVSPRLCCLIRSRQRAHSYVYLQRPSHRKCAFRAVARGLVDD